ncbi:unnamed protein product [Ilex paraguariensis]|uniref:Uncharacterized protein n=1 Tax=Ilex paraguariensis TaxID=185542 RepID=A0ABC8T0R7_9AQUA
MEAELKKCKRVCDLLTESVTRLDEEQRGYIDREKMYRDREKRAEERYEQLLEEYKKVENEKKNMILELTNENAELRGAKNRAEADVEAWKKRFGVLEVRVLKVEEDTAMLMESDSKLKIKIDELQTEGRILDEALMKKESSNDENFQNEMELGNLWRVLYDHEKINTSPGEQSAYNSPAIASNRSQEADPHSMDMACDIEVPIRRQLVASSLAGSGRSGVADVIEIIDSDDETPSKACAVDFCTENTLMASMPKRKRVLSREASDDEKVVSPSYRSPVFIRRCEEKAGEKHNFRTSLCSSSSDDSSDSGDENSDSYMNNMISNLRTKACVHEADMLMAFERDSELCMNAVCALYRQQTSLLKSVKGSSFSKDRGFDQFDALRGSSLARFLTDGDPEGKLKKTVKELEEYDTKGIDECRKLARRYSSQLFETYQKKEDPFFLPR